MPFEEREKFLFQILANSAAIAIHNSIELQKIENSRQLAAIGMAATQIAHSMKNPLQEIINTINN